MQDDKSSEATKARIILVGGGARSGKSQTALDIARGSGERKLFIATAQAFDKEMTDRILQHRLERPDFETLEKPFDLKLETPDDKLWDVILIDCLTLWLSNLLLDGKSDGDCQGSILSDIEALARRTRTLIVVSNEVGLGIVPDNALARRFRDLNGRLQQDIAKRADEVYFAVMGSILPLHSFRSRV